MKRVKILHDIFISGSPYALGEVADISDEDATIVINGGHAEEFTGAVTEAPDGPEFTGDLVAAPDGIATAVLTEAPEVVELPVPAAFPTPDAADLTAVPSVELPQ
jgi:hypothetical protein